MKCTPRACGARLSAPLPLDDDLNGGRAMSGSGLLTDWGEGVEPGGFGYRPPKNLLGDFTLKLDPPGIDACPARCRLSTPTTVLSSRSATTRSVSSASTLPSTV